ncbi:MAG: ATP-binding protein [Methanomassiliicoccales archaeon]
MNETGNEGERIGIVFGERVMDIRFRSLPDAAIQVGEMFMIEDGSEDRYLVRVTDVQHGADLEPFDSLERMAGKLIRRESEVGVADELVVPLYKVGVCTPLGCIRAGAFKKAKSIPSHFSLVRRTADSDYEFLRSYLGDVEVGRLRSGDQVLRMPVGFWGWSMPHHIGIFATTGMGKSNLMKDIALSCMRLRRYGFLILDPHGEYYDGGIAGKKGLRDYVQQEGLEVFSSRRLDGPHNPLKISATEIEIDDLANLYEFTQAQLECLQAAQWRYGPSYLIDLHRKDPETIGLELGGRFHEGSINVIKRRLENIFRFDLITTDPQYSITSRVICALHSGKVVLIDTSNMFEAEELLVSTVLARAVFERNKSLYADKQKFDSIPPLLIALEEAQRVLSQSKGTVFAQIAREGRKFKVGICAVSQQPKLINEEILSQFNTLFVLGLSDKRDRDILRNSAKHDLSVLDNEIQMLMPGEALLASPFTPFAVPIKVHLFEELLERENAKALEEKARKPNLTKVDAGFF